MGWNYVMEIKKQDSTKKSRDTNLDELRASRIQRHAGFGQFWNRVALHTALLGDGVCADLQVLQNVGDGRDVAAEGDETRDKKRGAFEQWWFDKYTKQ